MTFARRLAAGTVLCLILGLLGCQDGSNWVGEWRGSREVLIPEGADPSVAQTLAKVKLTIKPSGSFDLTEEGFTKSGDSSLGDKWAELRVKRMLGRNIESLGDQAAQAGGTRRLTLKSENEVEMTRQGYSPVLLTRSLSH